MDEKDRSMRGLVYASAAFLIWGFSPFYWRTLAGIPAFEVLMHRVVWSFPFLVPLVMVQKSAGEFREALRHFRTVLILLATTLLVALNWLIFIWAINNGYVLQTSLGYYINPLFNVVLGMVFLGERLRPMQSLAVLLAGAGVSYLTWQVGEPPWVALTLAVSFGLYGLIRKVAPVGALVGLAVETLLLCPAACGYLLYLYLHDAGALFRVSLSTDLMLAASAPVTALPLLLFNLGARRIDLSTLGFLQYIVPSCFFLFAVLVFQEPISATQVWAFALIWAALAIYSADSVVFRARAAAIRRRTGGGEF